MALTKNISDKDRKRFSEVFLFRSTPPDSLQEILNEIKVEIKEFEAGEKIYTPSDFENKVGFVLDGECIVEKIKCDGTSLPLNTLKQNDSFGILAVFSAEEKFPTQISAKKKARIAFLDKSTVIFLIRRSPDIALEVVSFMGQRIAFLNKKVSTFSADSVEEKFAIFLLSESKRQNSDEILLNLSKTAKALNFGRASVYRAIAALEKLSLIKFDNKKIYILNREGLERMTK